MECENIVKKKAYTMKLHEILPTNIIIPKALSKKKSVKMSPTSLYNVSCVVDLIAACEWQ